MKTNLIKNTLLLYLQQEFKELNHGRIRSIKESV